MEVYPKKIKQFSNKFSLFLQREYKIIKYKQALKDCFLLNLSNKNKITFNINLQISYLHILM